MFLNDASLAQSDARFLTESESLTYRIETELFVSALY